MEKRRWRNVGRPASEQHCHSRSSDMLAAVPATSFHNTALSLLSFLKERTELRRLHGQNAVVAGGVVGAEAAWLERRRRGRGAGAVAEEARSEAALLSVDRLNLFLRDRSTCAPQDTSMQRLRLGGFLAAVTMSQCTAVACRPCRTFRRWRPRRCR